MCNIILTETAKRNYDEGSEFLIYGHRCKTTNKWYIGETSYIDNPIKRFGNNGWRYKVKNNGRYKHPKFVMAINCYGWDDFEHYILDYADANTVDEKEIYWISYYNSLENGYNSTNGGMHAHKLSDENKRKISNPIEMLDTRGNIIMEFESAKKAAEYIGLYNNSRIINCCKGREKTVKGYVWRYKNGNSIRKETINRNKIKLEGYHAKTKVEQLDLETSNTIKIFDSAQEVYNELGIKPSCIYRCCRNERISTGGYGWRYIL